MNIQQLLQMAPFMSKEGVEEIAMKLEGGVTAMQLARLAPFVRPECVEALLAKYQPQMNWDALRRLALPENMTVSTHWTVQPQEIDSNGHLNNVAYIRHAEALAPKGCTLLEVVFDRECFAGETLTLETAQADGCFVRGVKENGEESFRARFWKENMQ